MFEVPFGKRGHGLIQGEWGGIHGRLPLLAECVFERGLSS